jgi:hypothetical protein
MSRSRRPLVVLVLALAAGACALSAPAASAAAPSNGQGVVLSAAGHTVRLVDRAHRVADVRVRSARTLRRGDVVKVRRGTARATGHRRKVAFLAQIVRSSRRHAVVRLGDGSRVKLATQTRRHGRSARSAAGVTVDLQGLQPGQAVLVTIATDGHGNVVLTIKLLPAGTAIGAGGSGAGGSGAGASGGGAGELHASGVVTDDEGEGFFAIDPGHGGELGFDDPQRLFEDSGAAWCDVVDVAYHADGDALVADDVEVTGQSDAGDCADDATTDEVDGTVSAIAGDRSALTVAPDDGSAATTSRSTTPSCSTASRSATRWP